MPALGKAVERVNGPIRFVVYTDVPQIVANWFLLWLPHVRVDYRPAPTRTHPTKAAKNRYLQLGDAERGLLADAQIGEAVSLVNADVVVSSDWFATAEKHFDRGKKLLLCYGGGRTSGGFPPAGLPAAVLKRWAWDHRHPWISECCWGVGTSNVPTVLFFEDRGTVVGRGFHIHNKAAFIKDRPLRFTSLTADGGVGSFAATNYRKDEMHAVVDVDEMGFAEITPLDRRWPCGERLSVKKVADFAHSRMTQFDRWCFTHRFKLVQGEGEPQEQEICNEILGSM